jgi:molybdopterin/thiamine biosynthesis adenylyltransferase
MTPFDRHSRHHLFSPIGEEGQRRLASARVAIVGCGALGSRSAELFARAGVGGREPGVIRIIDRDYVELSNLQRQALFDEDDAARSRPKAAAAERHIRLIDSTLRVEAIVRDLIPKNAVDLLRGVDLIVDGTDNFRTRFLINDAAIALGVPWIYGAAVASRGMVAVVVPGQTPCLRCLMSELPPLGAGDTCDTAGIITPLPAVVAGMQVSAAMRLIIDGSYERGIASFDLWKGSHRSTLTDVAPDPQCASCGRRELPALHDEAAETVALCGRNSVQLYSGHAADFDGVERRLSGLASIQRHAQSITVVVEEGQLTLFEDGRVIVQGTTDPLEAKSIVTRYLGG